MNTNIYRQAAENLTTESVSIEPDGTCWTGTGNDRTYLDTAEVEAEMVRLEAAAVEADAAKAAARESAVAKLSALGLDSLEIQAIIGGI